MDMNYLHGEFRNEVNRFIQHVLHRDHRSHHSKATKLFISQHGGID